MHKGTILYHQAFQFQNGEVSKKLLIILNAPQKDEPYLCCKTTSKQKYNIDREGCHSSKNIYVINPNTDWFKEKTWVQFHELYEFEASKFLKDHFDGKLEVKGTLKANTIAAIINCVKRSEDVSIYHLTLLR